MLAIDNITLFISNRCLFKNLNLQANAGDRIGLIGPNGVGKTTLLRLIKGKLTPEAGQVTFPAGTTAGYLEQEVLEIDVEQCIKDVALSAFEEAVQLEQEIEKLAQKISETADYQTEGYLKLLERLDRAQARYDLLEGDRKEARTEEMLEGLGFKTRELDEPVSSFSGGWRMRALLARLLLQRPDILLLDEPTNHLDIDSIEWLERYLQNYPGAVILVSHDRYFLNRMVNTIAEVRNNRVYTYTGNYDDYLIQKQEQMEVQKKVYESQQREIAQTERFISRFRAKATKARQVQSKIKGLERLERVEAPDEEQAGMSFRFQEPPRSGKIVLEIRNLRKTYPGGKKRQPVRVFTEGRDLEIKRGDKIALIGANGQGKSTLARILNGTEPFDGTRNEGHQIHKSFFAQHLADVLESGRTVLDEALSAAHDSEARTNARNILGCFLFSGDDVFKPVSVLSGGERSRLALAKTLLQPANFLILDEPTNHLDIASKNVLLQALNEYKGTVLAVSHDRHFLSGFAEIVWRAENGRILIYEGGYDYYEWKKNEEANAATSPLGNAIRTGKGKKGVINRNTESGRDAARLSNRPAVSDRTGSVSRKKQGTKENNYPKVVSHRKKVTGLPGNSSPSVENPAGQESSTGLTDRKNSGGPKSKEQKRLEAELRKRVHKDASALRKQVRNYEQELEKLEKRKSELEGLLADKDFYSRPGAAEQIREHAEITKKADEYLVKWTEAEERLEVIENEALKALPKR